MQGIHLSRRVLRLLLVMFIVALFHPITSAQEYGSTGMRAEGDSLSRKELRKERKEELRHSHKRFNIFVGTVFANLSTTASFDLPSGLLSARLGLESNLGLPSQRNFFTSRFFWRITPRSGVYALYYGINRENTSQLDKDIIFLDDTLHIGLTTTAFFNTQVLSAGYMLSILQDPNAFLGAFFNLYFMNLSTGIKSTQDTIDPHVGLTAPLPNFGVVAAFRLTNWLYLDANIGFFSLYTDTFGGTIYDLNVAVLLKPTRWLGFKLSYQEFDIRVRFPTNNINTTIEYNFKGPALGLSFTF